MTEEPGKTETIGTVLAEALSTSSDDHQATMLRLAEIRLKSRQDVLAKAVAVLDEHPHLCRLLKSDTGLRWLKEREYREGLGQVAAGTLGEGKAKAEEKEPAPLGQRAAVDSLLSNMVAIPAGKFTMGSDEKNDEKPPHEVELGAFQIAAMPVTQAQYEAVMGRNPSHLEDRPNNPVESISWKDAMEFCRRLSDQTGQKFTLPTEAQWEYACRAGSSTRYCFGASANELSDYAWYGANSGGSIHPVGQKTPNAWGLYDMHGNVWEWCLSLYKPYPYKDDGRNDLSADGPRVVRGGCWLIDADNCRSACRYYVNPDYRADAFGFRLVRTQK
ncbi:formylglycine-generating enzyme family protein [Candidatus Sumerlaeota bacterium]|nr:formylglycine-generating enzyme family protein [Candidatus Sumerlaeota bacterium]